MFLKCHPTAKRRARHGMVTWVTLLAVILLCLLISLVFNIGTTISAKLHTQNASDSIAYSNAVWMGRGMNAVTTANHMMGELSALYVLHHALGADRLDERKVTKMPWYLRPRSIQWAYNAVKWTSPEVTPISPDVVKKEVKASEESTLWQAKKKLKQHMLRAYGIHAAGSVIAKIPYLQAVGIGIQLGALAYEIKVTQEYLFLDMVEAVAVVLSPVKTGVLPRLLKALNTYTAYVHAAAVPLATQQVTSSVAKAHHVVGTTPLVVLPLVREKLGNCGREREKRAQLMRATYPWVHYWRKPLLDAFRYAAWLSGARQFYMKYTNDYSSSIIREFRRRPGQRCADRNHPERSLGLLLYVIKGLDPPNTDKTQEDWAEHKRSGVAKADRMFGVLGLARQKKPNRVSAAPFFRQANPDGVVCFSQAMLYNANPQRQAKRYRANSRYQPVAGWDTLNWGQERNRVVEYKSTSYSPRRPKIKLNWQAKLVPVSKQQLSKAAVWSYADRKTGHVISGRAGSYGFPRQVLVNH